MPPLLPQNPQQPGLPQTPDFNQQLSGARIGADFGSIIDMIKRSGNVPGMADTALPAIQALLAPGGQKASGYEQAIGRQTEQNVAAAQSDALRRGVTGSTIEAQGMGQARTEGQRSLTQFYSGTANQLSQMIFQAVSGDIQHQRGTLIQLAQAMGQELTSERDIMLFREQLKASMDQAAANRRNALIGAGIGAVGTIGGAMVGGPAGAAAGAKVGGSI